MIYDIPLYFYSINTVISTMFIILFSPYILLGCSEVTEGVIINITQKCSKYVNMNHLYVPKYCDYEVLVGDNKYILKNKICNMDIITNNNNSTHCSNNYVKIMYNHYYKNATCLEFADESDGSKWWFFEYVFLNALMCYGILILIVILKEYNKYIYKKKVSRTKKNDDI